MINYTPLWRTMEKKGFTTYTLIKNYSFSKHTIYRLKHNSGISTALINELCKILDCRVEEILEFRNEEENPLEKK